MKKSIFTIGAAAAVLGFVPAAMADFLIEFDMTGTAIGLNGGQVYGFIGDYSEYAGRQILAVGATDLEIVHNADSEVQLAYAMDISAIGYPMNIYLWDTQGPFLAGSTNFVNANIDIAAYGAVVGDLSTFGTWNIGMFLGSSGVSEAYEVAGGSMWYLIEGDPIPTPGAVALLGIAALVGTRRRRS